MCLECESLWQRLHNSQASEIQNALLPPHHHPQDTQDSWCLPLAGLIMLLLPPSGPFRRVLVVVGAAEEGGRGVPKGLADGLLAVPSRPQNENPPCDCCCSFPTSDG